MDGFTSSSLPHELHSQSTDRKPSITSGPVKNDSYQPFASYTLQSSTSNRGQDNKAMPLLTPSHSNASIPLPPPPYQPQNQVQDAKYTSLPSELADQQPLYSEDTSKIVVEDTQPQQYSETPIQSSIQLGHQRVYQPVSFGQSPPTSMALQAPSSIPPTYYPKAPVGPSSQPVPPPSHHLQNQSGVVPPAYFPHLDHTISLPTQPHNEGILSVPPLPPRPTSLNSEQMGTALGHSVSLPNPPIQDHNTVGVEEDRNSGSALRFVGNMLPSRIVRSTFQTAKSSMMLPMYLSPWGDNDPITLPNVRKRDIALGMAFDIGFNEFADAAVDVYEKTVQTATKYVAEQAVDEALAKASGNKPVSVKRMAGLNTMAVRISHKLMNEEAVLLLWGEREATNRLSCAKGWFSPYLYGSGRTPKLSRSKDFSMAQLYGPALTADSIMASTLLSSITDQGSPIIPISSYESPSPTHPRHSRMAIFIAGLSPYRANLWSQSRTPNECRLSLHILTHIPAIVLPVNKQASILAWNPWTLKQMLNSTDGYDAQRQHQELIQWCNTIVNEQAMDHRIGSVWRNTLAQGLQGMIDGIVTQPTALGPLIGVHKFNLEQAGFVAFRF